MRSDFPKNRFCPLTPAQEFPTPLRFPPLGGKLRYVGNFFVFRRDPLGSQRMFNAVLSSDASFLSTQDKVDKTCV